MSANDESRNEPGPAGEPGAIDTPPVCPKCGRPLSDVRGTAVCPECWTAYSVTKMSVADRACTKCGYNLRGIAEAGTCLECGAAYGALGVVEEEQPCLRCGYSLRGLPRTGACPECATPVESSLRGPLLQYSSAEYVASLHRGVFLVELGLAIGIFGVLAMIGGSLLRLAIMGTAAPPAWLPWLMGVGSVALTMLGLAGWWLLSTPDPAFIGQNNGTTARQVLRVTLVIAATAAVASLFTDVVVGSTRGMGPGPGTTATPLTALVLLAIVVQVGAKIAWVVQFFAAMQYLRWLGPRIPDATITDRARRYMWLLPLIYVLGAICLMIGPLIALLMYIRLLDNLRTGLRDVRRRIESGAAPLPAGTAGPV
jgi:hypothetical protein